MGIEDKIPELEELKLEPEIKTNLTIPLSWLNELIETYQADMNKAFDDGRRTQGYVYSGQVDLLKKIKEKFL